MQFCFSHNLIGKRKRYRTVHCNFFPVENHNLPLKDPLGQNLAVVPTIILSGENIKTAPSLNLQGYI